MKMSRLVYDASESEKAICSLYFPIINVKNEPAFSDVCEITTLEDDEKLTKYFIMPSIANKYSRRIGIQISKEEAVAWTLGVIPLSELFEDRRKWFKFIIDERSTPILAAYNEPMTVVVQIIPIKKPNQSFINRIEMDAIRN